MLCGGLVAHNVCGVGFIFVVVNHNENPKPHSINYINKTKNQLPYVNSEMKELQLIVTLY